MTQHEQIELTQLREENQLLKDALAATELQLQECKSDDDPYREGPTGNETV